MSTKKKKRSRKKQKVYTIHWPVLAGLTLLLVALVLLVVGAVRACALPEGDALTVEETPEPVIPAPTWSPLPVDINFTKVHSTYVKVFFPEKGEIQDMLLEEYILGVVAGEMPVSYSLEALKAQAVAARTYTLYSIRHGGCNTNPNADVCTSSSCCQTYRSDAKLRRSWGDQYTYKYSVIAKAVMDTAGEVMLYKGKVINAMYHAASGGWTEDSENVYSNRFEYLRSVESPHEIGSRQTGQQVYTRKEAAERINGARPAANVDPDKLEDQVKILSLYPSGRVEKIQFNEDVVSGRTAKKIFGLDSAMFTVEITDTEVIFRTKGFGHGVGMSQAGANGMAADGADYKTILQHYYTGVTFALIGQF
ncbi:MAG: stage II sporulation protein D [Clostridia bacterium]|nr:stage II sporulation protein D [Clostridia bacterium]